MSRPRPDGRGDGPRPGRLVVVAGTGTEVGKTWVTAAVARHLVERGRRVAARKPAQSFAPDEAATDADVLAAATGADPHQVCPPAQWYEVPMAPPMAADALGRTPPTVTDLTAFAPWPTGIDVGLVETAGGVRSPQAVDGDVPEVVAALDPDLVLLVADAGLGTINGVRLSLAALGDGVPVHVHLNRFDPDEDLHRRNRAWLVDGDGLPVSVAIADLATVVDPAGQER